MLKVRSLSEVVIAGNGVLWVSRCEFFDLGPKI